jgi:hypothetical protein
MQLTELGLIRNKVTLQMGMPLPNRAIYMRCDDVAVAQWVSNSLVQ